MVDGRSDKCTFRIKYSTSPSEAEVEYLMECANWAPTHHNTQPWRYVVIAGTNNIIGKSRFIIHNPTFLRSVTGDKQRDKVITTYFLEFWHFLNGSFFNVVHVDLLCTQICNFLGLLEDIIILFYLISWRISYMHRKFNNISNHSRGIARNSLKIFPCPNFQILKKLPNFFFFLWGG